MQHHNLGSYESEAGAARAYDRALAENGIADRSFNFPYEARLILEQHAAVDVGQPAVVKEAGGDVDPTQSYGEPYSAEPALAAASQMPAESEASVQPGVRNGNLLGLLAMAAPGGEASDGSDTPSGTYTSSRPGMWLTTYSSSIKA